MRTYALMRHLFICMTYLAADQVANPFGHFLNDELNTIRGNFKDEMFITPNVVGDRIMTGKNDWVVLGPVMASDDVIHQLNVAQRFYGLAFQNLISGNLPWLF